jgi:hypothetical protein
MGDRDSVKKLTVDDEPKSKSDEEDKPKQID